ncbi:pseudouridine synthase [Gongronella butleri]|nr:pseudouridine synthase [Gongronella butleri]
MTLLKQSLSGVLAVYKPSGMTSRQAATQVQMSLTSLVYDTATPWQVKFRDRVKVGIGGILDPLAEGVLVLGLEKGCKQLDAFLKGNKVYEGTAQFGQATDTYDVDGQVTETMPTDHINQDLLESLLPSFRGTIQQMPPLYSSLKMQGKRLYEYAREGKALPKPIEARSVTIHRLELLDFNDNTKQARYLVHCGGGTYIRSLLHDMGHGARSCAHMTRLVRTQQGPWTVQDCLSLDDFHDLDRVMHALAHTPSS